MSKKRAIALGIVLFLTVLAGVGYYAYGKATDAIGYAMRGSSHLERAFALIQQTDFEGAASEFETAERWLIKSKDVIEGLSPIIAILRALPQIGDMVGSAVTLVEMGVHTSRAGANLSLGLDHVLAAVESGFRYFENRTEHPGLKTKALEELAAARASFEEGRKYMEIAVAKVEELDPTKLPPELAQVVSAAIEQKEAMKRLPDQLIGLVDTVKQLFEAIDASLDAVDSLKSMDLELAINSFEIAKTRFSAAERIASEIPITEDTMEQIRDLIELARSFSILGLNVADAGAELCKGALYLNSSMMNLIEGRYEEVVFGLRTAREHLETSQKSSQTASSEASKLAELIEETALPVPLDRQLSLIEMAWFVSGQLKNVTLAAEHDVAVMVALEDARTALMRADIETFRKIISSVLKDVRAAEAVVNLTRTSEELSIPDVNAVVLSFRSLNIALDRFAAANLLIAEGLEGVGTSTAKLAVGDLTESVRLIRESLDDLRSSALLIQEAKDQVELMKVSYLGETIGGEMSAAIDRTEVVMKAVNSTLSSMAHLVDGLELLVQANRTLFTFDYEGARGLFLDASSKFSISAEISEPAELTGVGILDALPSYLKETSFVLRDLSTIGATMTDSLKHLKMGFELMGLQEYDEALSHLEAALEGLKTSSRGIDEERATLASLPRPALVSGEVVGYMDAVFAKVSSMADGLSLALDSALEIVKAQKAMVSVDEDVKALDYGSAETKLIEALSHLEKASAIVEDVARTIKEEKGLGFVGDVLAAVNDSISILRHQVNAGLHQVGAIEGLNLAMSAALERPADWVETGNVTWFETATAAQQAAAENLTQAWSELGEAWGVIYEGQYGRLSEAVAPLVDALSISTAGLEDVNEELEGVIAGFSGILTGIYHMDLGTYYYTSGELGLAKAEFEKAEALFNNATALMEATEVGKPIASAVEHLARAASYASEACTEALTGNSALAQEKMARAEEEYRLAVEGLAEIFGKA